MLLIFFILSLKDLNNNPKFLNASKDKVLEFMKNYKQEIKNRKTIVYNIIKQ